MTQEPEEAPETQGYVPSRADAGCAWFIAGAVVGLAVMFTALKLARAIAWPWWEALTPLWLTAALTVLALAAAALVMAVCRPPQETAPERKDP